MGYSYGIREKHRISMFKTLESVKDVSGRHIWSSPAHIRKTTPISGI